MLLYTARKSTVVNWGKFLYNFLFILVFMKQESDSVMFMEGYGYGMCGVY